MSLLCSIRYKSGRKNAELFHFTATFHEYLTAVTDVIIVFYQIQIWTEKDGEDGLREIDVKGEKTNTMVTKFIPHSKNFARVLVYNSRYNGPPSETLSFDTPEGGKDLDVLVSVSLTSDM